MTFPSHFQTLLLSILLFPASLIAAPANEQSFNVPLGQYFVLGQHGGPGVRMRVFSVDPSFVDMNYTDEFGRGWSVHAAKHNSVEGREANLTLLYRHARRATRCTFSTVLPLQTDK